ncbi:MAG: NAD(P)-dependent oxidoreductase [bacterium]|nr:NAD(P)-dependent oxidoreductase [bacterium]
MSHKTTIGFIGLGLMGKPMALNILKKGFPLVVYNRTESKTKELADQGAVVAHSPRELAEQSEIIVTMVTAVEDVHNILFSANGAIEGAQKGTLIIDMSTIGPTAAKLIDSELKEHGMHFIDAPVTGSTPGAINGTLTIFIGASDEDLQKATPLFETMGKNLQHLGPVGSGQAIKMINNHMIAATIEALSESMVLADGMNLSRAKVAEVLKTTALASPILNLKIDNYVKEDYSLLFTVANMKKDLSLALAEAKKSNKGLPLLETVEKQFEKAMAQNLGEEDFSTIIKVLKK